MLSSTCKRTTAVLWHCRKSNIDLTRKAIIYGFPTGREHLEILIQMKWSICVTNLIPYEAIYCEEFLKLQSLQEQISGETESSQHIYYKGL